MPVPGSRLLITPLANGHVMIFRLEGLAYHMYIKPPYVGIGHFLHMIHIQISFPLFFNVCNQFVHLAAITIVTKLQV